MTTKLWYPSFVCLLQFGNAPLFMQQLVYKVVSLETLLPNPKPQDACIENNPKQTSRVLAQW
jgi:hypothetical protein